MTRAAHSVVIAMVVLLLLALLSTQASAQTKLTAAFGNPHPPLVIDKKRRIGLLFDTIHLMNRYSEEFTIDVIAVPPKRIYAEHEKLGIDLVPYSNVNWGWKQRGGTASIPLIRGQDVFFSRRMPSDTPPPGDSIGAVLGFHYAFADFSHETLSGMQNVTLVQNEERVVQQVLKGRVHRGIASETYLGWLSVSNPEDHRQLQVLPDVDHSYERHFVVLPGAAVSVRDINALFAVPGFWNELQTIFTGYGLQLRDSYSN